MTIHRKSTRSVGGYLGYAMAPGASPQKSEPATGCEAREVWEGRYHMANVKILSKLGEARKIFGEPGGAPSPSTPSVDAPVWDVGSPKVIAEIETNRLLSKEVKRQEIRLYEDQ